MKIQGEGDGGNTPRGKTLCLSELGLLVTTLNCGIGCVILFIAKLLKEPPPVPFPTHACGGVWRCRIHKSLVTSTLHMAPLLSLSPDIARWQKYMLTL